MAFDPTELFLRKKFRGYYETHYIRGPPAIETREFGFGGWGRKIENRHISFNSEKEMNTYLARNAPLFVSYSTAQYKYPTAEMARKEWICAELVFDIDANEVGSPCSKEHGKNWVCEKCMSATKDAIYRLIEEFLTKDFGLKKDEISLNFSGNRGYHLHLNSGFETLSSYARREIADYVNGRGLSYESLFRQDPVTKKIVGPKPSDGGWRGRIARIFIEKIKERDLETIGVSPKIVKKFYSMNVISSIERGNWEVVYISDRKKFIGNVLQKITTLYGSNVDEQVTMDSTKLIRLPESLHGETGMTAMWVKNLDKFDPFTDPVVFSDNEITLYVESAPKFTLKNKDYGPYTNQVVTLPEYAAIYLIGKKCAKLQ
jgi:DNA primase small subunit